ncbi:histidine kinase [Kibdelosporangium phytohabitans]|uniref:histidine kinase n=1 Tax=Kibdelosporangium phytohabitans TaxID=860235 RepID=A0A0N9HVV1_9PSEU|nr:histidine kinase [Kibdelosporangium phytohabitans]ALG09338.1 hypothetical protein AOZ06_22665 [Kibdelosporangium phytohabitans]MBE1469399.1 signal transduction histidine kinase [Kibdelosporangium phytohabitans]
MTPRAQDALIAAGVFVFLLALPALDILAGMSGRTSALNPAVVLWTLASCVPLVWRRRAPLTSAAVTGLLTLGALWTGAAISPWAVLVAVFSAAFHLRRHRMVLGVGAAVWMLVVAALPGEPMVPSNVLTSVGLAALPISLGHALRLQSDRTRLLVAAEAERAQAHERDRVARDVHDLVGHQLSAIRLRALGSRKAAVDTGRALGAIADLAGEALGQVRSLVHVLREDGQPGLSNWTCWPPGRVACFPCGSAWTSVASPRPGTSKRSRTGSSKRRSATSLVTRQPARPP